MVASSATGTRTAVWLADAGEVGGIHWFCTEGDVVVVVVAISPGRAHVVMAPDVNIQRGREAE